MKNSSKILSIVVALGLLVAILGVGTVLAKQIERGDLGQLDASYAPMAVAVVAEDTVEWAAASDGTALTWVSPDATTTIYIRDGALEVIRSGTSSWTGFSSSQGAAGNAYNLADGTVNGATTSSFSIGTSTPYDIANPTSTPLAAPPVAKIGGSSPFTTGFDANPGTFTLALPADNGAGTTVTADFTYHTQDVYTGSTTAGRAKVTSTSDPQGEFVTISEVSAIGTTTASASSQLFRGDLKLSSSAAVQGTNNDGVWISDGDTVTVTYLTSAGVAIDTDTVTADAVDPVISSVVPADGTVTNVANPVITFHVTDTGSGIVATNPATVITIAFLPVSGGNTTTTVSTTKLAFQPIADGFNVIYADQTSWFTVYAAAGVANNVAFQWQITATDVAGNTKTLTGSSLDATIDQSKPTVASAKTGSATTAVVVIFNEKIDGTTIDAADFTVGGVLPSAAAIDATHATTTNLTVAAQAPDARPIVEVVGTISDLAGNAVDTALATDKATATDGIKPTISAVTVDTLLGLAASAVKTTVDFDERLAVNGATISVVGPSGTSPSGTLAVVAPTPTSRTGTYTVGLSTVTDTGQYGVSVQIKDVNNNAIDNLTTVTDETTSSLSTSGLVLTLANGPIADKDFDGDVDAADITALTVGGAATTITAVDAGARTITVGTVILTTDVVKVSYKYTTAVFEVDQTAPTVVFDPVDNASLENTSPFVRVIFTDEAYKGDTHLTSTLTKAELTNPDLTITDLLTSFSTADHKEYLWAASNLALGAYSLKVSATDDAGNALTDSISTFTVKARAKHSISLRPGWNLVSLPGAPTDSAINAAIVNANVDTVLTYDPTTPGGWMTAVRDSAGNLAGTLDTIDATRAYWVHTTTFDPILVDIPGITAGAQALPPSMSLVAGFNLIPVNTLDLATTERDPDEYLTGLDWARVYGYDNTTNAFNSILPDPVGDTQTTLTAGDVDNLIVGQGYIIFLNAAGTLVP